MQPEVSVVIPVFNEEESLRPLFAALEPVLEGLGRTWEIVFCDDGSRDGSVAILEELAAADPRIKAIVLRRNYGQSAAMAAGFRHATGDIVVPMDADLQNDPADIPRLLQELEERNLDLLKGWRKSRQDAYLTRTLPSKIANRIIGRITGVKLHDYGCTLSAFRAEVARDIQLYGEMHRFLPALAHWAGARIGETVVAHHPRRWGVSKYTLSKTFRVILDILTIRFLVAYSTKPLYFFGRFGFGLLGLGTAAATWTLFKKIKWGYPLYTDPFFLVSVFCMVMAVQVLLIGLIAELNVRIYYESQDKTPYNIRRTLNISED